MGEVYIFANLCTHHWLVGMQMVRVIPDQSNTESNRYRILEGNSVFDRIRYLYETVSLEFGNEIGRANIQLNNISKRVARYYTVGYPESYLSLLPSGATTSARQIRPDSTGSCRHCIRFAREECGEGRGGRGGGR